MPISRQTFISLYDKCQGLCFYCGWPYATIGSNLRASGGREFVIEPMTPRAHGGSDEIGNLTLACNRCNALKGNRTVEEFREHIRNRMMQMMNDALEIPGHYVGGPAGGALMEFWAHIESDRPIFFGELKPGDLKRSVVEWDGKD